MLRVSRWVRDPARLRNNLGLGEETVRTHIKKAQLKLGVRTLGAAIASAIRLHLIPYREASLVPAALGSV